MEKKNELALITGATGGLGTSYAKECAQLGYDLVLSGTKEEKLKHLKEELEKEYNVKIYIKSANLADSNSRKELFKFIDENKLNVTYLISNAGAILEGSYEGTSIEEITNCTTVNVVASSEIIKSFLDRRDKNRITHIIIVSSLASFYPMAQMATYASTKAFLTSLSVGLREELKHKNCFVTAVCPGSMATNDAMKRSIKSQGFGGRLSLQDTDKVARESLKKNLKNKAIYIPGFFNNFTKNISCLAGRKTTAHFINKRWTKCEQKRGEYR